MFYVYNGTLCFHSEADLLALAVEQNLEPTTTTTQVQSGAVETKSELVFTAYHSTISLPLTSIREVCQEESKQPSSSDKTIVNREQEDPPPVLEAAATKGSEPEPPTGKEEGATAGGSSKKTKKGKKGKKQAQDSKFVALNWLRNVIVILCRDDDIDVLLKEIEGGPPQQSDGAAASSKPIKQVNHKHAVQVYMLDHLICCTVYVIHSLCNTDY